MARKNPYDLVSMPRAAQLAGVAANTVRARANAGVIRLITLEGLNGRPAEFVHRSEIHLISVDSNKQEWGRRAH